MLGNAIVIFLMKGIKIGIFQRDNNKTIPPLKCSQQVSVYT